MGAATLAAWLVRRRRGEAEEWFEGEGIVRAGPPVDAPETNGESG